MSVLAVVSMWAAPLVAQQEPPVRAFVEVDAPAAAYVQQPVLVTVTIGYDAAWFDEFAVPVFRQQLDVPFHIDVPWLLGAAERAVTFVAPPTAADSLRIAVGDGIVRAQQVASGQRDGRTFDRLQLVCRWLPLSAGSSNVVPVALRYAYATEFTEDVLRGRQPVDRLDARVASPLRELVVRPLPQPVPDGFHGAVGQFEVTATSVGEQVRVGESFEIELRVTGEGNLSRFAPLPPPELPGFHVQGVVERRVDGARVFVLDVLALRAGLTSVPSMTFVSFSPAAGEYLTTTVAAVPVRVVAADDEAALPARVRELIDADQQRLAEAVRWPLWAWLLIGMALLAALRLLLMGHGKQQQHGRRRGQLDELRSAIGGEPAAAAAAFERLLAAVAGVDGPAFDLPAALGALRERGVAGDVVARVQAMHAELDGARFGGPMPAGGDVVAVAEAVVAAV